MSTIPVNQVASVLRLNVGDEATAVKFDEKVCLLRPTTVYLSRVRLRRLMTLCNLTRDTRGPPRARLQMLQMNEMMGKHPGFLCTTRTVCKSEWAYELICLFDSAESFGDWKTSATRDAVHPFYLEALEECGIKEEEVYGGARVYDTWFLS